MDGTVMGLAGPPGMVLQRFVTQCPAARRALYWRDGSEAAPGASDPGDGQLLVAEGGVLGFDTYFNSFFEAQWRRYTVLETLELQVTLSAPATVRVQRRALGRTTLLSEQVADAGTSRIAVAFETVNFRQHGLLTVELCATEGPFAFEAGAWRTSDEPVQRAALAAVFCTFNRETEIARVLASIGREPAVRARLPRIFVVNQGRPGLALQPDVAEAACLLGDRLTVIEQANFGGAGGFSRGLLAALSDLAITHAVLLDDDLELEPDSLLRMSAFYSYCQSDLVLGGHMLDLLQPTTLYEAGAVVSERHWNFLPQRFAHDLTQAEQLEDLSQPYAVHYNGWWCCGIPLAVIRRHGMPLPCFIRGDDLEFGLRLHQRGVPTVPMPGIAVWHEPFYLKLGGWQLYYETRNLLVAASLHQPFDRIGVARRMGRQIVTHLLTYRYYSTALILLGIRDFLQGPDVMLEPPLPRHARLQALKTTYAQVTTPREFVTHEQRLRTIPLGRLRCLTLLGWLLLRNAMQRTCDAPPRHMMVGDLHWLTIRNAGHVATETWWDEDLPTYRRTREHHRALLSEACTLMLRLFREAPRAARAWQAAAPELTSVPSWRRYLGLPLSPAPPAMADRADEAELASAK